MAQVILGGLGGAVGGGVGQAIGAALGGVVDRGILGALSPARQRGPRLETLRVQSSAEGAPMACAFGRVRVTGQVIWAARFLERRNESGGGKGGPRVVDHAYSLSFAVAVCEGAIDGIGRIWADGQLMDQTGVTMRVHRGTADQTPDPLIESIERDAPAYRGTAYVVFEDLPLGTFGNRVPQLGFEVFRRPAGDGLAERLEGVCLIPGAGEFVLASEPVLRRDGLTRTLAENVHLGDGRTDLIASLDQLQAQCPNLKRVSLVVGWFGNDLRAAHCRVRPGVESRDKATEPLDWSVAGLTRAEAHLISQVDGAPAYGGTPSDQTVRQAVAALKARGWAVTLYPFVFMDIAPDNALPDADGGVGQAAHPWRGRIRGRDGTAATGDVAAMFGAADGWGLRRLALHYAALAAETGCDALLIGSEMRGLTWTRDAVGSHPAVAQYRTLAAECRTVVGAATALSYAADWSEYAGHRPDDGSGDVIFHLDPLWADGNIDFVGIDWYPPLGDWRAGDGGVDGALYSEPGDPDYLAAQVAGGEGFDWFYAGEPDRAAQVRTPIVDTAHGEDWVFRVKDLVGWWSNPHHDRPGGSRETAPTAWVPGSKPIRLTEFGCAAVDRGGNAPNLFLDPKSSESFLPPFSTGVRDDAMQRRALMAVLAHFEDPDRNPLSAIYPGRMLERADAWCWDARPYPAFPARADVWADAGAWRAGHWLNGRLAGEPRHLLAAVLDRGGLSEADFAIGVTTGTVAGYLIDRPMRTRDALEPLLQAFAMTAAERGGRIDLIGPEPEGIVLAGEALAITEGVEGPVMTRSLDARPETVRVRFIDEGADYQTGAVVVRAGDETGGGAVDLDLSVVCGAGLASALAVRTLDGREADRVTVALGPLEALRLEPGDTVLLDDDSEVWRVERITLDEMATAGLRRRAVATPGEDVVDWRPATVVEPSGAPFLRLLDLPPLPGAEADARPIALVAGEPWRPVTVHVGETVETLQARGQVRAPADVGRLLDPLAPGPANRWDEANAIHVRFEGGTLASASEAAVLGGANLAVVETPAGWEILQFRQALLVGDGRWRLTGLLRGQQGTDREMAAGAAAGAMFALLDSLAGRFEMGAAERTLPRLVRAGPSGQAPGGPNFTEAGFTWRGVHGRPWSPAGLRAVRSAAGLEVSWFPRTRTGGDIWDLEPRESDPRRFRLRALDGGVERRTVEVEGLSFLYATGLLTEDFPGGPGPDARLAVAQYGDGYGWGVEAVTSLVA